MPRVYAVDSNDSARLIPPVSCEDETRELQGLLEKNLDLLPGEQIRPEDPLRWMLVKREMPVPGPSGMGERWSIDLLLADQDSRPTFVECKRYADTRSRREVVGQMLDYAANGRYYWTKDALWKHAEAVARANNTDLESVLENLGAESDDVDEFFQRMEDNLKAGQVRLLFFMEQAPYELRSIVEFLNSQMERSEVLIVEAWQFQQDGLRLVVPMLFGYTEQARRVKKVVTITSNTEPRRIWDEDTFFQHLHEQLGSDDTAATRKLYNYVKNSNFGLGWGTGRIAGSFGIYAPNMLKGPRLLSVYGSGKLEFPFAAISKNEALKIWQSKLVQYVLPASGLQFNDNLLSRYPQVGLEQWGPNVDKLIEGLQLMLNEIAGSLNSELTC